MDTFTIFSLALMGICFIAYVILCGLLFSSEEYQQHLAMCLVEMGKERK